VGNIGTITDDEAILKALPSVMVKTAPRHLIILLFPMVRVLYLDALPQVTSGSTLSL
jgi:hypothetical protein